MSVSFVGVGTGADSSGTTLSLGTPGGLPPTSGHLIIALVAFWNSTRTRPTLDTLSATAGWQFVGDTTGTTGGGGTYGADTGPRDVAAYYKVSDGTETAVGFDLADTDVGAGCRGYTMTFSRTQAAWATPASVAGADSTDGTAFSCTASGDFATTSVNGDMLAVGVANRPDTATQGSPAVTYASGTYTQRASGAATAGHDGRHNIGSHTVTATSTGAPVFTATLSAAGTGSALFVRLHDTEPTGATVDAVAANATARAEPPAVEGVTSVSGGGPATATAVAHAPAVTGVQSPTVAAVTATATSQAPAPTVTVSTTVTATTATGTGQAHPPVVSSGAVTIAAVTATAAAEAPHATLLVAAIPTVRSPKTTIQANAAATSVAPNRAATTITENS